MLDRKRRKRRSRRRGRRKGRRKHIQISDNLGAGKNTLTIFAFHLCVGSSQAEMMLVSHAPPLQLCAKLVAKAGSNV